MEDDKDNIPLQEIVYKPTTLNNASTVLKAESPSKFGNSFLYFAALVANLVAFTAGIAFAWTSPVLPKLDGHVDPDDNPLGRAITPSEKSWIAGLLCLGSIFGPLAAGPAADRIGRKRTLLIAACPMAITFVVTAFAKTVLVLYICRFVMGIGAGSVFTVLPMYLGEIAENHNRGTLGCLMGANAATGILFGFVVGPYLSIRNFCLVCVIPLLIFFPVFSVWIPESPHFLASANRQKDLESSLSKLRNSDLKEIRNEALNIIKIIEENRKKGRILELFKRKGLRRALIITLGIIILQQFSGINAVLAYMQTIFDATESQLAPEIATIIVGTVKMLSTVAASYLVDRVGRRMLLISSASGCCVSLISLGVYFHLKSNQYKVEGLSWLPVLSLIVYVVGFNIGLGPLPFAIMAELFPSNVKSVAATITSVTCFSGAFFVTLLFPIMSEALGMANSFWTCSVVCFLGTIFVYFVLPETKGKSLQEIQTLLQKS